MTREAGREKETFMTATARVSPSSLMTELLCWHFPIETTPFIQKCSVALGFSLITALLLALNILGSEFGKT